MTLGQLLIHLRERVLRDKKSPSLWGDAELTAALNQAESIFARSTHCLMDDESAFTTFDTVASTANYLLDPRIVHVYAVFREDGTPLTNRTKKQGARWADPGEPRAYTLGAGSKSIRLHPVPDDAYNLQLLVARKPLQTMVAKQDEPEIPEEYHLSLCDYATARALMHNEPEGSKTTAAEQFERAWGAALVEGKRALYQRNMGTGQRVVNNWTGK